METTEGSRKHFTVDEFYRMADVGIFDEDSRVELINGEILEMSPIGNSHASSVDRAAYVLITLLRERANVRVQNPLCLDAYNEPQPDLVVVKYRADFYKSGKATPADVLLVIEVSDSSLPYDREVKLPIYAIAGITELWIEDLQHDCILVYRDPVGDKYKTAVSLKRGESISIAAFPDVSLRVDDLLG